MRLKKCTVINQEKSVLQVEKQCTPRGLNAFLSFTDSSGVELELKVLNLEFLLIQNIWIKVQRDQGYANLCISAYCLTWACTPAPWSTRVTCCLLPLTLAGIRPIHVAFMFCGYDSDQWSLTVPETTLRR